MRCVCFGVPLCDSSSDLLPILPASRAGTFRLTLLVRMLALLVVVTGLSTPPVEAQGAAHFGYAQVTIGGGFNQPVGVAVDGTGNVYVADNDNNAVKGDPAGMCFIRLCDNAGRWFQCSHECCSRREREHLCR
jgi:hypothetical protein